MFNANLKTVARINKDAYFIIKLNLYLINLNNKPNASMDPDVQNLDVHLNINKNNRISQLKVEISLKAWKNSINHVTKEQIAKDLVVCFSILKNKPI